MIRKAIETDFPATAKDECMIRILALKRAYGCDVAFIQYFTDENNGFLSIMDGAGILSVPDLTDEWLIFLQMNPDMRTLHCTGTVGEELIRNNWQGRGGIVMRYDGPTQQVDPEVTLTPYLPKVYALLETHFPGISPLDYWYPDVSHRIRHCFSHIACVERGEKVVSTAMTVAETDTDAIIGQVATDSNFRQQGLAGKCIKSTICACEGKALYILPINETAQKLYQKLGFVACDTWYELERT